MHKHIKQAAVLAVAIGLTAQALGAGSDRPVKKLVSHADTGTVSDTAGSKMARTASIKDFGAKGDCVTDDTAAIQATLAASDRVYWPKPVACYKVSSINIRQNKTVITDGMATVIKQIAGQAVGTRTVNITGSNVRIGSVKIYGNISTDTNEQQHAILIQANAKTGNISNVTLGDIVGQDIRGDVLYVGQRAGYTIKNVTVGNVGGDNIYRNVVSFVSGTGLKINSITGSRVGFAHFDAEPDAGSGPAKGINIGSIKGRVVGLVGTTTADYVDDVKLDSVDLDPAYAAQSSPAYPPGVAINDGLMLRNLKSAKIGRFTANGFNRSAIFTTYNSGELGAERLTIDRAEVSNCAQKDVVYKTCFNMVQTYPIINSLKADIRVPGKNVINGGNIGGKISNASVNIASGSNFINASTEYTLTNIQQTGGGIFISGGGAHQVIGGSMAVARLSSFAGPSIFDGVTATASEFLWDSAHDRHIIRNSKLNDIHHANGATGKGGYADAMRMGAHYVWIETATGKIRMKETTPTMDADGTVIGTPLQ